MTGELTDRSLRQARPHTSPAPQVLVQSPPVERGPAAAYDEARPRHAPSGAEGTAGVTKVPCWLPERSSGGRPARPKPRIQAKTLRLAVRKRPARLCRGPHGGDGGWPLGPVMAACCQPGGRQGLLLPNLRSRISPTTSEQGGGPRTSDAIPAPAGTVGAGSVQTPARTKRPWVQTAHNVPVHFRLTGLGCTTCCHGLVARQHVASQHQYHPPRPSRRWPWHTA